MNAKAVLAHMARLHSLRMAVVEVAMAWRREQHEPVSDYDETRVTIKRGRFYAALDALHAAEKESDGRCPICGSMEHRVEDCTDDNLRSAIEDRNRHHYTGPKESDDAE
jgi:hypothetical protein